MATGRKEQRRKLSFMILLMSVGNFVLHMAVSENYQLHQEAYLFLNYASHPAWGYISEPPFIMVLSFISVKIFGGAAFAVRFFPALASSIMVGLIGVLIKDLGGRKWAILLGTLSFALSPAFLNIAGLFHPLSFNVMFWFFFFYAAVQMLRTENYNYWYIIGLIVTLGLLNKYSMIFPVVFMVLSFIISGNFKVIFTRQFWISMIAVIILIIPNIIWQYNHNWPIMNHASQWTSVETIKMAPAQILSKQFLMNSPSIIVWMSGLFGLLAYRPFRKYIAIFLTFMFTLATLVYFSAKPYNMLGIYPILFVFGAYGLELITWQNKHIMPTITAFVAVVALVFLPLGLPLIKTNSMVEYSKWVKSLGIYAPFKWDDNTVRDLPEDHSKMIGWKEITRASNDAFESLSDDEKTRAAYFSPNMFISGALNYYNRKADYPVAFSLSASYLLWTPQVPPENVVLIVVGTPSDKLQSYFDSVEEKGVFESPYSVIDQTPIYILKGPQSGFYDYYGSVRDERMHKYMKL